MVRFCLFSVLSLALLSGPVALAQTGGDGIDFVTISAPGNAPWAGNGDPDDMAIGRGQVNYEYKIGRMEVTTAQWVEFFNAAYDRPTSDRLPHLLPPDHWGAAGTTPNTPGGLRWRVPAGNENLPVGDISWRMAAMYCNWLHNDKRTDRAAFLNGAYDVSTFGWADWGFSDQLTHNPDAKYWIPTWDEWLKAAHYDPNKVNGDGTTGGWWLRPDGGDGLLAYGPPGMHVRASFPYGPDPNGPLAQANAGWNSADFPGFSPFAVPLGSYAATCQSPWGLLDVAGGTREWTEEVLRTNGIWPTWRQMDGSSWTSYSSGPDRLGLASFGEFPNTALLEYGFRLAASVPSPGACVASGILGILLTVSRTRHGGSHANLNSVRHVRGAWGGGAFGSEVHAQSIVYSYDGGTPVSVTSGQDFTVNVGTVSGVKVLRIYDPSFSALPDDDAGKVTISGFLGTDGELRVLIVGSSQTWPTLIISAGWHRDPVPPRRPALRPSRCCLEALHEPSHILG